MNDAKANTPDSIAGDRPPVSSLSRLGGGPLAVIVATDSSLAPFVLRLFLAAVIFPHGAQKVLGVWGGNGFSETLGLFTEFLGIPAFLALLVFAAEFLGPIGLLVGAFTRLAAAGLASVMVGAIVLQHAPNGFFMNWSGTQVGAVSSEPVSHVDKRIKDECENPGSVPEYPASESASRIPGSSRMIPDYPGLKLGSCLAERVLAGHPARPLQ